MTMPETYYRTGNYKVDHSTFGGVIHPTDFYTNYTNGNNAERIARDWAFDRWCGYNTPQSSAIIKWRNKKND